MARSLKFQNLEEEALHYRCSENKGDDRISRYCTSKLICAFVFAYPECLLSRDAAQYFVMLHYFLSFIHCCLLLVFVLFVMFHYPRSSISIVDLDGSGSSLRRVPPKHGDGRVSNVSKIVTIGQFYPSIRNSSKQDLVAFVFFDPLGLKKNHNIVYNIRDMHVQLNRNVYN